MIVTFQIHWDYHSDEIIYAGTSIQEGVDAANALMKENKSGYFADYLVMIGWDNGKIIYRSELHGNRYTDELEIELDSLKWFTFEEVMENIKSQLN